MRTNELRLLRTCRIPSDSRLAVPIVERLFTRNITEAINEDTFVTTISISNEDLLECAQMDTVEDVKDHLSQISNPDHAQISARYFKTGPGEYGEGDLFRGVRVPVLRSLARSLKHLEIDHIELLLRSEYHEDRLLSLILMVNLFKAGAADKQRRLYRLYLANTRYINNWDLVDTSAEHIVGGYLSERARTSLYLLAESRDLWKRRISIMSTFYFIKNRDYSDALKICQYLIDDTEDLIHKACGWMLREIGNRDLAVEEAFLDEHATRLPRTMLRYAIEKFTVPQRQHYMKR